MCLISHESFFPFRNDSRSIPKRKINDFEIAQARIYTAELSREIFGKFRAYPLFLDCHFWSFTDEVYDLLATILRITSEIDEDFARSHQNILPTTFNTPEGFTHEAILQIWHRWKNLLILTLALLRDQCCSTRTSLSSTLLNAGGLRFIHKRVRILLFTRNIRLAALPATPFFHSQ